ncbi:MAG: cyanophycinase [Myxococcales bacterium]|nr:cyanophycinase [Myxococcales bacterium]
MGGAEDKEDNPIILERFVKLCGGDEARIAVIPTASELDDTGLRYERIFLGLGAGDARSLDYRRRSDADHPQWLAWLREATGVFLTGGNQLRITTILGGTTVARTIRTLNASGVSVGGTSAGAAVLSEHMVAFGASGATPVAGRVTLAPGLGLTNRVVIDQHFRERDRIGRLLAALALNPFAVGVGLDEDTAAFIDADDVLHVVGRGAVTIIDANGLEHSSMGSAEDGQVVCMTGLRLHVLPGGGSYDLHRRVAEPPPGTLD